MEEDEYDIVSSLQTDGAVWSWGRRSCGRKMVGGRLGYAEPGFEEICSYLSRTRLVAQASPATAASQVAFWRPDSHGTGRSLSGRRIYLSTIPNSTPPIKCHPNTPSLSSTRWCAVGTADACRSQGMCVLGQQRPCWLAPHLSVRLTFSGKLASFSNHVIKSAFLLPTYTPTQSVGPRTPC